MATTQSSSSYAAVGSLLTIAFAVGLLEFGVIFSDSTRPGRLGLAVSVALILSAVAALACGILDPPHWLVTSLLGAWGALVCGIMGFAMDGPAPMKLLAGSAVLAPLAGYAGGRLRLLMLHR